MTKKQIKKVTFEILSEYEDILKKHGVTIQGDKTIKEVKINTKNYYVSLIDLIFESDFYHSNDYNLILNDLIRMTSKYMNENSNLRIRLVEFSNSPKILNEIDKQIKESFFAKLFNKISNKIEKDAIEKYNIKNPERIKQIQKNKEKIKAKLTEYEKNLADDMGIPYDEFKKMMKKSKDQFK